jgi:hypothetical protein
MSHGSVVIIGTAWDAPRRRLWQGIAGVAGAAEVTRVQALPSAEQVSALLRTTGWGGCAGLVNSEVLTFLADVYMSLQAPRCTAQEALDSVADVACQLCHSRGREASLSSTLRWLPQGLSWALPHPGSESSARWSVALPALRTESPAPYTAHFPPAAARGPMAFGLRLVRHFFLSLFLVSATLLFQYLTVLTSQLICNGYLPISK